LRLLSSPDQLRLEGDHNRRKNPMNSLSLPPEPTSDQRDKISLTGPQNNRRPETTGKKQRHLDDRRYRLALAGSVLILLAILAFGIRILP
jgi:hypothetical protein